MFGMGAVDVAPEAVEETQAAGNVVTEDTLKNLGLMTEKKSGGFKVLPLGKRIEAALSTA